MFVNKMQNPENKNLSLSLQRKIYEKIPPAIMKHFENVKTF